MTYITCMQFYLFLFLFFLSIALFVFEPKLLFWVQSPSHNSHPHKIKCTWFLNMKVFVDSNFWINGKNAFSLFSKIWGVTNLPPLNKISSRDLRKVRNLREIGQKGVNRKTYSERWLGLQVLLWLSCCWNDRGGCSGCLEQASFRLRRGAAVGLVHWAWGLHC